MPAAEALTAHTYLSTIETGRYIVHDVPIFAECERGSTQFDAAWILAAVKAAREAESESYLPPLHVRHHPNPGEPDTVRAAGMMRVTRAGPLRFRGSYRMAIFADLIITDPCVAEDVAKGRLPWRSVEIFDVAKPAIGSLALLDHEAPFLELPLLMTAGDDPQAMHFGAGDEETFAVRDVLRGVRSGRRAVAITNTPMEAVDMATQAKQTPVADQGQKMAAGYDDKDKESKMEKDEGESNDEEKMEAEGMDVESICAAIKSGEISVADMQKIMEAIAESQAVEAPDEDSDDEPAPAATPGAEAMSKREAQLRARLDLMEAKIAERDEREAISKAVEVAMKRLSGRPLGSDLDGRLTKFRKAHGQAAFEEYVDTLAEGLAALDGDDSADAANFRSQSRPVSKAAMKFAALGAEALERANQAAAEHKELAERRMTHIPEARYIELHMARHGYRVED